MFQPWIPPQPTARRQCKEMTLGDTLGDDTQKEKCSTLLSGEFVGRLRMEGLELQIPQSSAARLELHPFDQCGLQGDWEVLDCMQETGEGKHEAGIPDQRAVLVHPAC